MVNGDITVEIFYRFDSIGNNTFINFVLFSNINGQLHHWLKSCYAGKINFTVYFTHFLLWNWFFGFLLRFSYFFHLYSKIGCEACKGDGS